MKMSVLARVPGLAFCAGIFFTLAFLEGSYQTGATVQASTNAPLEAEASTASNAEAPQGRRPVLVELVTSEDCTACQSAEQLLTHLDRDQPVQNADIIVLNERLKPPDPSKPIGYLSPTDPTRRQED
jgi:hypothetical protein